MVENIFYIRLKEIIKSKGKSFNQLERELNYPRNSLNNYRYSHAPSAQRLVELSEYLRVPPGYLIGKTEDLMIASTRDLFFQLSRKKKLEMWSLLQQWIDEEITDIPEQ